MLNRFKRKSVGIRFKVRSDVLYEMFHRFPLGQLYPILRMNSITLKKVHFFSFQFREEHRRISLDNYLKSVLKH